MSENINKFHTECRNAIRMFGPLNSTQLAEKLKLRGYSISPEQIKVVMEEALSSRPHYSREYYLATGFSERTYK